MSGFKEGSVQLRKKDIGNAADPNHLKILVDTNNNLYTIDEFGVYRAVAGYDIQVSGTSLTLVTSGATKIISLSDTGVISGSYGSQTIIPAFTVSPDGRIVSVSSMPISATGLGTVTSVGLVSNSLVVSSSPVTISGNIFVGLSAIGASGTFTKIVKDQYGRITSGGYIGVTDILDRSLDGTLSANSDNKIPTEKAIKTYVDENDKRLSVGICDPICYDIIDNGDGTAQILSQNVYIYDNPTYQGNIKKYYVSGTTLSFVDNTEQLVCIKYNSGNPIFYLENHPGNVNESDIICVHICWRQGNTIHSIGRDSKGLGLANKIAKSILWTNPYSVSIEGGLVLSESSTPTPRTLNITSATVFAGIVPITVSQFNSSVDKLTFSYHQSGNWVYSSSATTYNNFYYDDGNNLQEITNNKFVCLWIYRSIGDIKETFYVVGNNYYNSIESARLESQRSDLPLILRRHCILVGRIIIQKGQNSGIVENISKVNFSNTSIPNHNDLNNIQGGSETERYHISATTYSYLSAVSADIQYQLDNRIGKNILEITKEPTGFPDLTSSNISFNNSTRTFTISAVSGTFDVYYRGNRLIKTIDQIQIQNVSALNYIYYTSAGILTATHTPWDILTTVQIALVYWTGVSALSFCEERHGTVMDCATHFFLHNTVKTRYVDGFDSNYTLSDSSKITFGLTDGRIADEDLTLSISNGSANSYFKQPINSSAYIPVYYRQGLNGDGSWRKDTATIYPFKNNGGTTRVAYNQLSGSTWVQSEAPSNTYVPYYIFATNIISEPIISIQGQRYDSNINESRNNVRPESLLVGDFPTAEAKLLYTLIVSTNNGYTQNPLKARIDDVVDYRSFNVTIGGSIGGTGTVTYVGLSANSILTISGSPVIDAGTFLVDFSPQLSSTFLRGPTSGSSKIPTFGPILSSDIPNISNLYLPLSGGTLTGQLKGTTISASGNVSGNSFIKNGGTSSQFLKADGSSDSNVYITSSSLSPYTLLTTTSAISANLQSQINNDKNSLSAYLPLSGGNVYGRLYLGNSSNNGYLDLKTNGTSAGQTDINYRGGTSATRRMTVRYDEITDAIEIFSSNDDGSARTNIQRMYRNNATPSRYYTGLDIFSGNLSVQSLSASKLVATDASKNLISYTLTSADIANHAQSHYYNGTDPINGQSLSGLLNTSSPTFSTLKLVKSLGATISAATRIELLNNDSTYGQSFWSDSGGNLKLSFLQGDSIWSDRFTFFRTGVLSAVGNITANAFIKNGGTSSQFLKADGSVDSNTYASQSFVNANYLPLSGGNVYGSTIFGNPSNNGYVSIRTNGTSGGIADFNFIGSTSAARRLTFRYNEITDALEFFTSNDNGSARANKMLVYRSSSSATNFYTGLNVATGNFSIQALSASKLVATNSSKNLISYVLTSGDMPGVLAAIANLPNAEGCLKNTDAGVVTWEKTLPINSYSTLGMSNFTGQSVYVYEALSGRGLGFSDSRGLNWRGGFVSTSAAYGFHQDATSISSFKPFTISDGVGNVWYSQNPLGSSNHTFTGTGRFSSTLSANSFVKIGGTSNQFLKADGSVDSNIYQTVSAYNQSISGFLPLSGGTLTGNLSANQTIKITKGLGATISAASRLEILNTDSTWGISPWADSGGNLRLSFLQGDSTWTDRYIFNRTGALSAFGNITATNFVGTLDGSKNVQSNNETTIANGYANTGGLWINWRGAASAITEYRMGSGRSDDAYANVKANGFIKNGGSSNQFLKADGSVDSNSFSNYLSLSGGTMTGSILGGMVSATNFYDTGFTGSKVLVSDSSKQIIETTTTTTEVNYLVGVSANVQTQLNALKQNSLSGIGFGTVNRITKFITTSSVGDSTISDNGTVVSILNAVSAGGNITATNFVGTLDGSKNVQSGNETTIANNYNSSDGNLWINYRGAIQSIKMYNFVNGFGKNYSGVMASAFKLPTGTSTQFLKADGSVDSNSYVTTSYINNYLPLSGGTLTGNLKISAVSEGWSEGVRIMATSGNWGGFRLTRTSSPADIEDNWAVGYANNSTGNLEYDVYTSGSQLKHTIFYKNGNVYHLGNVQTSELIVRDSALISTGTNNSFVRIKSSVGSNNGYIEFGTGSAFFGYSGTVNQFLISGHFVPSENNVFDLGENLYRWRNLYCNNIYENGSLLSNRYLPLSGGTMTGDINFSNPVIGKFRGLRGTVGNSDVWRIGGNSNSDGDDNGFIEIVTGDNGDEPIYVRQEKAYDDMLIRTATLLDGSGNTSFPGFLSATKIYITANNQQNLYIGNDASLGDADIDGHVRLQGRIYTNMGYITYGNSDAYFGFDSQRFVVNRNIRPYFDGDLDLGGAGNYWANVYSDKFIRRNGLWDQFLMADGSISYGDHLSSKFLPLSGGIMTGSIRGNDFDSGSTAIISNAGYGNFQKISVRHSGSLPPTDINFVGSAYLGGWIYQNTYSKFYNSSTSKSNALIICEGNDSGYGGLYFGGRNNSYIGQTSDGVLHIRGLNGIEFDDGFTDDYGITFNQKLTLNQNITNHITYTTATDSSDVFPDDRTYYKITVNGDKVLPTPVESKVIYIYNAYDGMGATYLKAPSGVTIYYYNFSGLNKSCSGSQKIQIPNDRTIALIGNSSTKYSIIGQWGDPV